MKALISRSEQDNLIGARVPRVGKIIRDTDTPFLGVSQKYLGNGRVPGVIHAAPHDLSPHTHLVVAASVCVNTQEQLGSGRVGYEGRKCRIEGNRGRRQCASLVWQKLPEICESNSSENS